MKTDEILRTKKESGLEEFEQLRHRQQAKSAQAARTASLSRREADAPEDTSRILVRVTAVERQGLDGFNRAGQFWPSAPGGRLAVVTRRMLAALKSESMLRVEVAPEDVPEGFSEGEKVIDVPVRESVDLSQVALAPAPGAGDDSLRAAYELGRAHSALDKQAARIADLEAQLALADARSAAATPPTPAPAGDDDGKKGGRSK